MGNHRVHAALGISPDASVMHDVAAQVEYRQSQQAVQHEIQQVQMRRVRCHRTKPALQCILLDQTRDNLYFEALFFAGFGLPNTYGVP